MIHRLILMPPQVEPAHAPGEHQHHQNRPAVAGPQIKVRRGISGGGHHRGHAEKGIYGLGLRSQHSRMLQIQQNRNGRKEEQDQIPANLLHLDGILKLLQDHQIVEVEVHAEQCHKHGHDPFAVEGVFGKAGIQHRKSAGACGTKGQAQGLKGWHPADPQQQEADHRQAQINPVEPDGRLPEALAPACPRWGRGSPPASDADSGPRPWGGSPA